jgi:short-subunit dehydrogenase
LKKVVVTGASKGIGYAVALRFAAEGNEVIICARNNKELEDAARRIGDEAPYGKVYFFPTDMSTKEGVANFYRFIAEKFTRVDVLVNNTGIYIPGQTHNEEEGVLEQMLDTNLHSAYRLTRLCVPEMMEARSGQIFNICSTASIIPYVNGGSYGISKYALYGFTKVLREEMKPYNIKVTAVLPGATFTNSWQGTDLPETRFMNARDIAEAIFMAAQLPVGSVVEEILMRPQEGDIG